MTGHSRTNYIAIIIVFFFILSNISFAKISFKTETDGDVQSYSNIDPMNGRILKFKNSLDNSQFNIYSIKTQKLLYKVQLDDLNMAPAQYYKVKLIPGSDTLIYTFYETKGNKNCSSNVYNYIKKKVIKTLAICYNAHISKNGHWLIGYTSKKNKLVIYDIKLNKIDHYLSLKKIKLELWINGSSFLHSLNNKLFIYSIKSRQNRLALNYEKDILEFGVAYAKNRKHDIYSPKMCLSSDKNKITLVFRNIYNKEFELGLLSYSGVYEFELSSLKLMHSYSTSSEFNDASSSNSYIYCAYIDEKSVLLKTSRSSYFIWADRNEKPMPININALQGMKNSRLTKLPVDFSKNAMFVANGDNGSGFDFISFVGTKKNKNLVTFENIPGPYEATINKEISRLNEIKQQKIIRAKAATDRRIVLEKIKRKKIKLKIQQDRLAAEQRDLYAVEFRKVIKRGDDTNYGLVVKVERPLVQIQMKKLVRWFRIDRVFPELGSVELN